MLIARENINPSLLTFSRECLGYDVSEIAKKMQVKEERWTQWEKGEGQPTTNQLIRIAKTLDRTPAFFYLKEIPAEEQPLSGFRTINSILLESASPRLLRVIREAKRNRETLLDLYQNQNRASESIPEFDDQSGSIKDQAKQIRNWLGIKPDEQFAWSSNSNALTSWKNLLESRDIYVIQFPYVDVSESRGFAIAKERFPVIGINSKDSTNARIFTLIHELAHVIYRDSIIVNDVLTRYFKEGSSIEQRCNRLAAEIVVPGELLSASFDPDNGLSGQIKHLAHRFRVSEFVMLIRLKNERLITSAQYDELQPVVSFYGGDDRSSDGGSPYYNQIVRKGKLYLRTAFQSYFDNQISIAELANLTGWKVPNLNKLAAKTFSWPEGGQYV